jgi:hypothetical protein
LATSIEADWHPKKSKYAVRQLQEVKGQLVRTADEATGVKHQASSVVNSLSVLDKEVNWHGQWMMLSMVSAETSEQQKQLSSMMSSAR